jgi:hypothetical protein
MKNDDGSTTVKLEICTSEVFTPEFIQLVQDTLVATANKKIGDGDTDFTPEELSAEVAEVMVPCVVEALKRSLMLGLVRIAQDPGASYEGVFGKDEEEDESKHE